MREKQTKTVEKVIITCDKCGWKSDVLKEGKWNVRFWTCSLCEGDFCEDCGDPTDYEYVRGQYGGDNWDYWICDPCWKTGEPFLEQHKKDEEEFELIGEKYWEERGKWKEKWKKAVNERK